MSKIVKITGSGNNSETLKKLIELAKETPEDIEIIDENFCKKVLDETSQKIKNAEILLKKSNLSYRRIKF